MSYSVMKHPRTKQPGMKRAAMEHPGLEHQRTDDRGMDRPGVEQPAAQQRAMNHWLARRHLSEVLDGSLPAPVEARVRAHVRVCTRCRDVLHELAAVDRMLRRMPRRLLPTDAAPEAERRLAALARWAPPEVSSAGSATHYRWCARALGIAAAVAIMLQLSVTLPADRGVPKAEHERWMAMAATPSDADAVAFSGWR